MKARQYQKFLKQKRFLASRESLTEKERRKLWQINRRIDRLMGYPLKKKLNAEEYSRRVQLMREIEATSQ